MTKQSHDGVTIYDVARVAGVAASTVSRTFAHPGRVNATTAARVREAAEQLGYRPPQGTHQPQARLIGLMVSDVANPFFSPVIRGTQIAANELGFEVLLADSRESASREQAALERLAPVVQGFVIGNTRMPDSALRSIALKRPTVVLNRALPDVSCVVPDNRGGIQAALQLLFDLGHRDVHYVAGPEASWPDGVRWRAVQEFGPRIGLAVHRVGPTLPTFDGGLAATEALLALRPTAVIGYNDLIAVGVLHGLLRSGIRVPQQVSVVGFDDILISRLVLPTLTTIAAPMRQMGTTALHNLVAVINGARPQSSEPMVMPVHVRVRGSTGPAPAG